MDRTISIVLIRKVVKVIFFTIFIALLSLENTFSQSNYSRLSLTAGLSWRSAPTFFSSHGAVFFKSGLYDEDKNVQGFSLNLGLRYKFNDKISLEYYPSLRYDYMYHKLHFISKKLIEVYNNVDSLFDVTYRRENINGIIIDHDISLLFSKRKFDFGIGITLVNAGKGFEYEYNSVNRYLTTEFLTYNAIIQVPIKKVINLELKINYVPNGFPEGSTAKHFMHTLRAYYKFNFPKKKRDKKN